jgi:DNA ligase (NAD+)
MDEDVHTTTVTFVDWKISKLKKLIPVVHFEPVHLANATMQKATQNNAKYIEERQIGPGSVIRVTRTKDVIPFISVKKFRITFF